MLNFEQQEAVDETGPVLVVACPGSGKSRVIVEKAARILSDPGVSLCAVTFSRDAADELVEKVEQRSGAHSLARCKISTFHSLAIGQLRDAGILGQVATPLQQANFVNRIAKRFSNPDAQLTFEEVSNQIESAKCVIERDDRAMSDPMVAAYEKLLKQHGMCDLNDVVRNALLGMRDGTVKPVTTSRGACSQILVDEFQDCDEVQFWWMMEHVNAGLVPTVVGDDDQTIYAFRRALGYRGMEMFLEETNARRIALGVNYRCHAEILEIGDNLIRHNAGHRVEKELVAARGRGGHVQMIKCPTPESQAEALIEVMEPDLIPYDDPQGMFDYTVPDGKWAILARNHMGLHEVQRRLMDKRIRFQRAAGKYWDQYFLSVYLDLLSALQKGESLGLQNALDFVNFSVPAQEAIHTATKGKLGYFLNNQIRDFPGLDKNEIKAINEFTTFTAAWRKSLREGQYPSVIYGTANFLCENGLNKEKDGGRRATLQDAAKVIVKLGNRKMRTAGGGERSPSLSERVEILRRKEEKAADGVRLLTLHSCKGLEFPAVGLFHMSHGVMPDPERLDDLNDRRLLYVGITRAKDRLYVTYDLDSPSRFFHEMRVDL